MKRWEQTRGIFHNIAYTDEDVYAFYRAPAVPYTFTDNNGRNASMRTINSIFEGISSGAEGAPINIRLYVVSDSFDPDDWMNDFTRSTQSMTGELPDHFEESIFPEYKMLGSKSYSTSSTIIRIKIGKRQDASRVSTSEANGAWEMVKDFIDSRVLQVRDQEITEREIDFWVDKESYWSGLMKSYGCEAVSGNEIALRYRSILYPGMDIEPLPGYDEWGQGDIYLLCEGDFEHKSKYIKVTQHEGEGYCATLAFQKLPPLFVPAEIPWMSVVPSVDNGTNSFMLWMDAELVSSRYVKKDIAKYVKIAQDEQRDAEKAGASPLEVYDRVAMAEELEFELASSNEPWVYGSYYITVTAPTPEELADNITLIRRAYRDREIMLAYPTGKPQVDLFYASLPGGSTKFKRHIQRHPVSIIGGGMPTVSTTVGD